MRLSLLNATKGIQEFDGRFIIEILIFYNCQNQRDNSGCNSHGSQMPKMQKKDASFYWGLLTLGQATHRLIGMQGVP